MDKQQTHHYAEAYEAYKAELSKPKFAPLKPEEERALIQEYSQTHSRNIFERLVEAHLRFVIYLLSKYSVPPEIPIMDVIQEGNIGLMIGIQKYDPQSYSCRVGTYCAYWIRFYMSQFLNDAIKRRMEPLIDDDSGEEVGSLELTIPDDDDEVARKVAKEILGYAHKLLTKREYACLTLSLGLLPPYQPKTLQEIGSMLHLNLERVRQLREAAIQKIKYILQNPDHKFYGRE